MEGFLEEQDLRLLQMCSWLHPFHQTAGFHTPHLSLNPHLCQSIHSPSHPLNVDCMSSMLTATWWVLTEPGLDPDGTGVCEKNKIHHSLALRPWASYLSTLGCNFLAEFSETKVLMRITREYRLKYLEPSGCSYLVSWFLLHGMFWCNCTKHQKTLIVEKDVLVMRVSFGITLMKALR